MKPVFITLAITLLLAVFARLIPGDNNYFTQSAPGLKEVSKNFPDTDIEAVSAVVVEYPSLKRIYQKDPGHEHPLASITKLMTALVYRDFKGKQDSIYFPVRISPDDIAIDGDSGFFTGEIFSADDLADIMLVSSSNDAARALASFIGGDILFGSSTVLFLEEMNKKTYELGLENTFFINESGLDVSKTLSGGYGTAWDVAKLVSFILGEYPDMITITGSENLELVSLSGIEHKYKNTNELVGYITGLVASKTGFTDLAGGNLVLVVDMGFQKPVIIVVLGSSFEGRFKDAYKLYLSAKEYYQ